MEIIDSLRDLLMTTGYGPELLIGLLVLSSFLLFMTAREFSYRYLKLHQLRRDIRSLEGEITALRQDVKKLIDQVQTGGGGRLDFLENTEASYAEETPEARAEEPPRFPLNPQ